VRRQGFFSESQDTFLQDLLRARPTIFFSVPRLWTKFKQGVHSKINERKLCLLLRIPLVSTAIRRKILQGLGLDQCRVAAGGAAPMQTDVLQWYRNLGLDLIEVYGMTENSGVSHSTLPGSRQTSGVGLPHDGVECRIAPDTGEIQMRCPAIMKGYYRSPELTAEAFTKDGWLRTGDLGRVDEQGNLFITGRMKDQFKTSKGKYVAPAGIEDRLVTHDAIEACAVTGANFPQPFAVVMLSPDALHQSRTAEGKAALEASLARHLIWVNQQLEPHEKLDFLAVSSIAWTTENGMVTPTLKVKRSCIDARYAPYFTRWSAEHKAVCWA